MIRILCLIALILPSFAFGQRADTTNIAVLRWLDRTSGELVDLNVQAGQLIALGHLQLSMTECRYPAGSINRDAFAHLTIRDTEIDKDIFNGWMVASAPALNALEHRRYDIWVLRCKTS